MQAEDTLKDWFIDHGWPWHCVEHAPIFTVEEGRSLKATLPGGHSKSLLVEDRDKRLFLIVALGENRVDLKGLQRAVGAKGRFSFAREERMVEVLKLRPGSVTPLGLSNDLNRHICGVILDTQLMAFEEIWCHPLRNTASVRLPRAALMAFIEAHFGTPSLHDVAAPQAPSPS